MRTVTEFDVRFAGNRNTTFTFEPPLQIHDTINSLGQLIVASTRTEWSTDSRSNYGQVLDQAYQDAYNDLRNIGCGHRQATEYVAQLIKEQLAESFAEQQVIVTA